MGGPIGWLGVLRLEMGATPIGKVGEVKVRDESRSGEEAGEVER